MFASDPALAFGERNDYGADLMHLIISPSSSGFCGIGYLLGSLLTGRPQQSVPLKKGMLVALDVETPTALVATLRFALSSKVAGELAD